MFGHKEVFQFYHIRVLALLQRLNFPVDHVLGLLFPFNFLYGVYARLIVFVVGLSDLSISPFVQQPVQTVALVFPSDYLTLVFIFCCLHFNLYEH